MAKAAEAVEAAIAGEAKLDAHTLRADFLIFQQRVHGKPLAYLDSAVSAQKPRQVLDAARARARPRAEPGGARRGDRPAARTRPPSAWLR